MKLRDIRQLIEARSLLHGDSSEYVPLTLKLAGVQAHYFEKLLVVAEALRALDGPHHALWCDAINQTGMQGPCNCGADAVESALAALEAE